MSRRCLHVDGYFNDFYILRENERIWCTRISHDEKSIWRFTSFRIFPSRNVPCFGSLLKGIHMWRVFGYFYASAWTRSKVKAEIRVSSTGLISVDYQHLPRLRSAFSSLSTCSNQQPIKFIRFVAFCHSHFRLQPDKPIRAGTKGWFNKKLNRFK